MGSRGRIPKIPVERLLCHRQTLGIAEILHQKQLVLQVCALKDDLLVPQNLTGKQIPPDKSVEHRSLETLSQKRIYNSVQNPLPVIDARRQQQLHAAVSGRRHIAVGTAHAVRSRLLPQPPHCFQRLRFEGIIGIQKCNIFARCFPQSPVPCLTDTGVFGLVQRPNPRILRRVAVTQGRRRIRTAVIHQKQLPIRERLLLHTLHTRRQQLFCLIDRHNYGNAGHLIAPSPEYTVPIVPYSRPQVKAGIHRTPHSGQKNPAAKRRRDSIYSSATAAFKASTRSVFSQFTPRSSRPM